MANPLTYGQEQAERNLEYWKILDQPMRKPTALASPEERRAYTAQQVRGGELPSYMLPEQYGGMPVGSTRRAIRARSQWADQQAQMEALMEQQREMEQAQREERRLSLAEQSEFRQQKAQDLELKKQELLSQRESKIQKEADFIFDTIRGGQKIGVNPDGSDKFSEPIRPTDPESFERISGLMALQYGMENQAAKEAVMTLYNDALKTQESLLSRSQKQAEQQQSWLVGQQEEAASVGVDTTKFFTTKVDPLTNETVVTGVDQLGLSKAIGEAKRNDLETKKKEVAAAKIDEDSRSQARSVLDDISKIDSEIRKANFNAQKEKNEKLRQEHINNAEFYRSERDILVQRFNSLVPQQQMAQPQQIQQPQTTGQRPALGDIFGGR